MRFKYVATICVAMAGCPATAADGDQPIGSWVSEMMRRIPFKDGYFNREALMRQSQTYLEGLVTHYREIGERPRRRAEEAGNAFRVHEIESRTEKMIGRATKYVHATSAGMVATLDPDGTGQVTRKNAQERLGQLADRADTNGDGLLDRYEAALAEAAFAKGVDLALPQAEMALQHELDLPFSDWE